MDGQAKSVGFASAESVPMPKEIAIKEIENGYLIIDHNNSINISRGKQYGVKDFEEAVELLKKLFQTGAG